MRQASILFWNISIMLLLCFKVVNMEWNFRIVSQDKCLLFKFFFVLGFFFFPSDMQVTKRVKYYFKSNIYE